MKSATTSETQTHYTLLQVVTESYRFAPKIVKTETETITPYFGKVNNSQIRGLRSTLQDVTQKQLCNVLFQSPNVRDTNPYPFVIISI